MKKAKVIISHLSGNNGRTIFKHGQTVTEKTVDNFDKLVKSGRIELFKASEKEVKAQKEAVKAEFETKNKWLASKENHEKKLEALKISEKKLKDAESIFKKADKKDKEKAQTKVSELAKLLDVCKKEVEKAKETLTTDKKVFVEATNKLNSFE